MGYRNFKFNCVIRVMLIGVTIFFLVYLLLRTSLWMLAFFAGCMVIYLLRSLIHYVEKSNRDLARFLQAIKYEDFSETFSARGMGASFEELNASFADVTREIRRARSEREEHYQYLQTIVQHIGIGVISFQPDGEVQLINNAAKRLLGVSQLKDLKALESFSKPLVNKLLELKSGDSALIKVEQNNHPLQLAVYAAEFRMRGQHFTLVSLQNIQNELERERMSKELEIAYHVQMKLLPKESPKIPGVDIAGYCIPAKEVGGDYYDFMDMKNGKIGIAVGDVSGKGVPAAIYMTLAKGVIQSQAEEAVSPRELLIKANNLMYQSIEQESFVSMFFAKLDCHNFKMVCSRAGHNPAVHFSNSDDAFTWIQPEGIALGLEKGDLFNNVIQDYEIQLKKGDWLILYTDGFVEAMDSSRSDYGEERLLKMIRENKDLKAKELIKAICHDVTLFSKNHPQYDDMTMVAIKVL